MKNPQHILISRTDNIGDVILTLPLASLLKKQYPHAKISFLTRNYAKAVVTHCPYVDGFVSYDDLMAMPHATAVSSLKNIQADWILHVFPRKKVAQLAYKAKIKNRIGTSRRWYHYFFCNRRINFTRAKSDAHEAELNLKLLAAFNLPTEYPLSLLKELIIIEPKIPLPEYLKCYLNPAKFNLIIHPFSNGNGREWPLDYFIALIKNLPQNFNVLVTGTQNEKAKLTPLLNQCPNVIDACGKMSLDEFFLLIKNCDGLVANSTGPLHMAAALGIKTLGLYPPAARICPKRWGPLGKQAQYIVHTRACAGESCSNLDCACMRAIEVSAVKQVLLQWIETPIKINA